MIARGLVSAWLRIAIGTAASWSLVSVPIAMRNHALTNPRAIMKEPLTLAAHQSARMVVDPLRLFDCCLISDGAAVVLIARGDRARDLRQKPVRVIGIQGTRSGRDEFIFAPRSLGINQQSARRSGNRPIDFEVFAQAGVARENVQGFYTYDAFSPLVLFALERF